MAEQMSSVCHHLKLVFTIFTQYGNSSRSLPHNTNVVLFNICTQFDMTEEPPQHYYFGSSITFWF